MATAFRLSQLAGMPSCDSLKAPSLGGTYVAASSRARLGKAGAKKRRILRNEQRSLREGGFQFFFFLDSRLGRARLEFHGDQTGDALLLHRNSVERLGGFHSALGVGDHDELGMLGHFFQQAR